MERDFAQDWHNISAMALEGHVMVGCDLSGGFSNLPYSPGKFAQGS